MHILFWLIQNLIFQKIWKAEKNDKFLNVYGLSKLNLGIRNNLNRPIISYETEAIIKGLSPKKSSGQDRFTTGYYELLKKT